MRAVPKAAPATKKRELLTECAVCPSLMDRGVREEGCMGPVELDKVVLPERIFAEVL